MTVPPTTRDAPSNLWQFRKPQEEFYGLHGSCLGVTIGLVGPCAAGKSTLARRLRALGYQVRHIAQEHSYVPDMWRRVSRPDVLIYLDVSFPVSLARRPMAWREEDFAEQQRRLRHARAHADFVVQTDRLTPEEVAAQVVDYLTRRGFPPPKATVNEG